MGNFFAELRRRHIYRVGAGYVVVAWVLAQAVDLVTQIYAPPAWIPQTIVAVLAIGFPVALAVAWMIEGKAHEAVASAVRSPATTVDWVLAGAVIAVLLFMGYQRFVPSAAVDTATADGIPAGDISIAVLPFTNLSSDPEQEFFSDGMTEEITAALAKVPGLRVVARTSAFQFKGQNADIGKIGEALHASHLIEGSVRKEGNELRITAQLIGASDGSHLWAESYDRELTGVFAVQEEIAQAIAGALSVPLGLEQGQKLVSSRTNDVESYQQYLRARASMRARAPAEEQIAILEPLVARDPTYAPAWALLARAYRFAAGDRNLRFRGSIDEARALLRSGMSKAEMAAREAIRLDPTHSGGYSALGDVENAAGRKLAADELREKALALDPGDADNLDRHAAMLGGAGRLQDALRLRRQLAVLEPFVPVYNISHASLLLSLGEREAAIRMLEATTPNPNTLVARNFALARAYILDGRNSEAADFLLAAALPAEYRRGELETAARIVRAAPSTATPQERLPLFLPFVVYTYLGAYDRLMDFYERSLDIGNGFAFTATMWGPDFASMRKTGRFKTIMQRAGYVDYWRARGWPDLCRPVGADDFECN